MANQANKTLLRCDDMSFGYDGTPVVKQLSFSVEEGDYLCIVGENGAGKSTLLKTLLGLISPLQGSFEFSNGLKQTEIGYLPQQTAIQKDFPATVKEVVQSGCLNRCGMRPYFTKEEKALVTDALNKLGIEDLKSKSYRDLSGGQQQKVLLARALCATKRILLLDEPMASLDPIASADMYQTIESLNTHDGITIVMISHDISAAIPYASDVLHLGNQTRLFFGKREDYLKSPLYESTCVKRGA